MDRALIERMLGAIVLVLLLVVVAPALLDGSRSERSSDEQYAAEELRTEIIVLNDSQPKADAYTQPEPESAPSEPLVERSAPEPDSVPPKSAPPPAPVKQPATVKKAASSQPKNISASATTNGVGDFAVQLGSFRERANASDYANGIKRKGFAVFVRSGQSSSGAVHRVYAGPRPSRAAAEKLVTTLAAAGYDGMVVDLGAK